MLYVKSATGETTDYKPSEDFAKSEPFEIKDAGAEPVTYDIALPDTAVTNAQIWTVTLTLDNVAVGKINAMKFGTGSKSATWTFTALAGTTTIRLYALGWSGKNVDIKLTPNGSSAITESINSNSSISGSSTTITLNTTTEEAFHEISLGSALTQDTNITITNNSTERRFLLWGIQGVK